MPVRNPWDHVRSLRRQHERFLKLHAEDPFGLAYMQWLGHFEFGGALRPIDFAGWIDRNAGLTPLDDRFWLTYWVAAFEAVLATRSESLFIVDHDGACAHPEPMSASLATCVGTDAVDTLVAQADRFRAPSRYQPPAIDRSSTLARRVADIYDALLSRAIDRSVNALCRFAAVPPRR